MINYARNAQEGRDIVTKTIDRKFEEQRKCIFKGAGVNNFLSPEQWKQSCQDLLRTFFSRDRKDSGIITFLETNFTAQGKPWHNVMSTLKKWCKDSN